MNVKLRQIVADATGIPVAEIGDDASMSQLAAWDSVAHLNIVMSVEQEFGVRFSGEETLELTSVPAFRQALQARGFK